VKSAASLHPALSPTALTAALQESGWLALDGQVIETNASPIGAGQVADTYRVEMRYGGAGEDAPKSLVAKLPPADLSLGVGSSSLFEREARFYAELAPLVATQTPQCFGVLDWDGRPQGVLLEDLVGRANVGNQIGGASVDQVERSLDALLPLQANSWERTSMSNWPLHLKVPTPWLEEQYAKSWVEVQSWLGSRLTAEQCDVIERFGREMPEWGAYIAANSRCFAHQDFRVGNILFGEDELWVVDWQVPGWSTPGFDIAYLIGTSFDPEVRRSVERRLVERHGDSLQATGVDWDRERAWVDYLRMAPAVLAVNVSAAGMAKVEGEGAEMFHTVVGRGAQFLIEAESMLAALGEK
jgi:hypothetical protein